MAQTRIKELESVLESDPRSPSFVDLAEALLAEGAFDRVVSVCEAGLGHHPEDARGRVLLGRALLMQGHALQARNEFARVLAADPMDGSLYASVGHALLAKGLYRSAVQMLRRAVELCPDHPGYRQWLADAEAERLPVDRPMPPPPPLSRGPQTPPLPRSQTGDWLDELPEAPAEKPMVAEPQVEQVAAEALSAAAVYEQELRERLVVPGELRNSSSRRSRFGVLVALSLVIAGGAGFGAYEYRRAANREADIARFTAAARNGIVRDTRAAYLASVNALNEVLDRNPENPAARALRALAIATLAQSFGMKGHDAEEARALLGAAEEEAEPELVIATRWVLAETEEERKALEDEILRLDPARAGATVHSLAGAILLERKDPAQAIDRFNEAIAAMPSHVPTLVRVADYYRSRGEHADSLRYYQLALAVAEDHPAGVLGAAEAQMALGRDVAALRGALSALDQAGAPKSFPLELRTRRAVVRARLLSGLDRRDEALAELEAALADRTDDAHLASVALAFVQVGAPDRAESLIGTVRADSPLALRETRARALLAQERYKLLSAIPTRPEERQLHLLKGMAHYHLGAWTQARAAFRATGTEQVGRLPADAVVYLALIDRASGRGDKGRATLERLGTAPRARTPARWAWASVLREEGRWKEAEEVLAGAIARDPLAVEPHCALGRLRLGLGDLDGAEAALQAALRLNPFHSDARVALSRISISRGDLAGTRSHIEAALAIQPDHPDAWATRALASLLEGDVDRARQASDRALSLGPKSAFALAAAARVAEGSADSRKALGLWRRAVGADGTELSIWLGLGAHQLELGQAKAARSSFARALALSPTSIEARLGEARTLLLEGKAADALSLVQAILDELPENAPEPVRQLVLSVRQEASGELPGGSDEQGQGQGNQLGAR